MFGKKKGDGDPVATLIGAGTTVTGDLHFRGGLHLDGRVLGDVVGLAGEPSRLTIGAEGVIEGAVTVDELDLLGLVQGDVVARSRIELGAGARVNGDVIYRLLQMAEGAHVNGRLIHHADPAAGLQAVPAADVADVQDSGPASRDDDGPGLR